MGQKVKRMTTCGHCGKSFLYTYDLERVPAGMTDYNLSCPHCGTKQDVPLQTVRTVEVLRGGEEQAIIALSVPDKPVGNVRE